MPRQLKLSPIFDLHSTHGGSVRQGRRKLARPIITKLPMHVVFRSSRAKGASSMLLYDRPHHIRGIIDKAGRKFGVRLYQYANAGNHLHILIRGKTREGIQNFLRTVGAQVATYVLRAKRGSPRGKFWDSLAFSRLVTWGRDFFGVKDYVLRNEMEAWGVIPYRRKRTSKPPPQKVST